MATKRSSAALKREIETRASEALEKALPEIEDRVNRMIDNRLKGIVSAALGMDMTWSEVRVDHCNGRKTAIANRIGDLAMERVTASFDKWLAEAAPGGRLPKGWKAAIREEYGEALERGLRERVSAHVHGLAQTEVERMVAEALSVEPVALPEEF